MPGHRLNLTSDRRDKSASVIHRFFSVISAPSEVRSLRFSLRAAVLPFL